MCVCARSTPVGSEIDAPAWVRGICGQNLEPPAIARKNGAPGVCEFCVEYVQPVRKVPYVGVPLYTPAGG